jgi:hypothetical protein
VAGLRQAFLIVPILLLVLAVRGGKPEPGNAVSRDA